MNTKQVAKAAQIGITTINAWLHRGHFPGLQSHPKGRGKEHVYSEQQAIHAVVMSDLAKLRFGPNASSKIAATGIKHLRIGSITITIDRHDVARRLREAVDQA